MRKRLGEIAQLPPGDPFRCRALDEAEAECVPGTRRRLASSNAVKTIDRVKCPSAGSMAARLSLDRRFPRRGEALELARTHRRERSAGAPQEAIAPREVVPLRGGGSEEHELEQETCMREQDGPEDLTQRGQMRRLLEARVDRLPEEFRIVFVLRAVEEMTVEETAAALDISEATVRTRFFRARSQLREALSQEIDLAVDEAFAFAGERCERIVARVFARLAAGEGDLR
ncbi:MAG TPA: sigma-70 family RNA polymerase sigma factor [Burkholderiales bacterium]|nr:sigma-70 family RNA polymerase sigma factor [Burkholderiales bacterium]